MTKEKQNAYARQWRSKNKNKVRQYLKRNNKKYYQNNREKVRASYFKSKFNITLEQRDKMIANQNNLCAICKNPPAEGKCLEIDHNHITGAIRKLLCHHCNIGIGSFKDNIITMESAIQYLKER